MNVILVSMKHRQHFFKEVKDDADRSYFGIQNSGNLRKMTTIRKAFNVSELNFFSTYPFDSYFLPSALVASSSSV